MKSDTLRRFFALDGQNVLTYSTLSKMFWQSGVLDEAKMTFKTSRTGLLYLDGVYVPKTELDGLGQGILWDWIPERHSEDATHKAG